MKNKIGIYLGVSLILISLVAVAVFWKRLPEELPWLYSLPDGESQLLDKRFFTLGIVGVGWAMGLNVWLSRLFLKKDEVLTTIIIWAGVGIVMLYTLSIFRVLILMI